MTATSDPAGDGDSPYSAAAAAAAKVRKPRKPAKEPFQALVLARRHPTWGAANLGLLVAGVVTGYVLLVLLGPAVMRQCAEVGPAGCDPRDQARGMALPILGMLIGLVISLFGGRLLAGRRREPMPAAWAGWGTFLISGAVAAFVLA